MCVRACVCMNVCNTCMYACACVVCVYECMHACGGVDASVFECVGGWGGGCTYMHASFSFVLELFT